MVRLRGVTHDCRSVPGHPVLPAPPGAVSSRLLRTCNANVTHAKEQANLPHHRRHAHPGRRRDDDHGGGRTTGHPHPAALLPPRPEPGRLMPGVRGGRQRHGLLPGRLQLAGLGRDGGADQLAGNPPGPARHRRTAAGQSQYGLPDLRAGRPLRTAEPGLRNGRQGPPLRGPAKAVPAGNVEPFRRPRQRKMRPLRPVRPRLRGNPGGP